MTISLRLGILAALLFYTTRATCTTTQSDSDIKAERSAEKSAVLLKKIADMPSVQKREQAIAKSLALVRKSQIEAAIQEVQKSLPGTPGSAEWHLEFARELRRIASLSKATGAIEGARAVAEAALAHTKSAAELYQKDTKRTAEIIRLQADLTADFTGTSEEAIALVSKAALVEAEGAEIEAEDQQANSQK